LEILLTDELLDFLGDEYQKLELTGKITFQQFVAMKIHMNTRINVVPIDIIVD
jgi:hypothetical protein